MKHLSDLAHSGSTRKRMSLPLGLPHPSRRASAQQEEIREARKFLKNHLRTDWDYPPLPRFQIPVRTEQRGADDEATHPHDVEGETAQQGENDRRDAAEDGEEGEGNVAGFRFYHQSTQARDTLLNRAPEQLEFEPLEWRERDISSDETPDSEDEERAAERNAKGMKIESKLVYKYDNPDSIGADLAARKLARKRKRQELLDEECTWNDGVAHWLARRDAWCGAHVASQVHAMDGGTDERSNSLTASLSTATSTRPSTDFSEADAASTNTPSTTPDLPPETASSEPPIIPTEPPAPPSDILVPLVPPILVDNPVRRRIGVDVYPEIYSKIILQSRTPSVPINLVHMTRALVQGWRDDGEWPPKPMAITPREKKYRAPETVLKNGVKAVGRALRLGGGESAVVQESRS